MTSTITATIMQDRHLEIDLPEDIPLGPVEVVITPLATQATEQPERTRDDIRARLKAAGLLSESKWAPEDAEPLADYERETLERLYSGTRLIGDLVDEDRGQCRGSFLLTPANSPSAMPWNGALFGFGPRATQRQEIRFS